MLKYEILHELPAISREQQMNSMVLQVALFLQVRADQLTNLCRSVCMQQNTPLHIIQTHYNKDIQECTRAVNDVT